MSYVPLHVHTVNSTFRGMMTPQELVDASVRKGFEAVAMTDCWNTFGHYDFFRKARDNGIKPLLGVEISHSALRGRDNLHHLTLLAENNRGYRNITSIVQAHYGKKNGRYVTPDELKENAGGVIALTGSIEGEICQSLLGGSLTGMKKILADLAGIFGPDNIFIELMNHNTEKEWFLCDKLIELSRRTGIPSVVTNNDRFVSRDSSDDYLVLDMIGAGHERRSRPGGEEEYYLKVRKELEPYFTTSEDSLDLTGRIAERCNVELPEDFELSFAEYEDARGQLKQRCLRKYRAGLGEIDGEDRERVENAMRSELKQVEIENVIPFMIFLSDLFSRCRDKSIQLEVIGDELQQSILSFLLGITNIEPTAHGLVFECFCSEGDYFAPHLELITDAENSNAVFGIMCSILPECRIFYRVMRVDMSFKKIVEEVCSVMDVDGELIDNIISFAAGEGSEMDISSMFRDSTAFREMYGRDHSVRRIFHLADAFRGRICHFNLDSSRAVLLPEGAERMVSVLSNPDGEQFLQCGEDTLDLLRGWSFTLRHSRALAVISATLKSVGESSAERAGTVSDIPLDDSASYRLISSGDTDGVYLLESAGVKKMLSRIRPMCFDIFVDALSLYRPAPLKGELWRSYVDEGSEHPAAHDSIHTVLRDTRGVLLYREQVRRILEITSGMEGEDIYRMEKMLYDSDPSGLRNARLNFIRNCMERGIEESRCNSIFDFLRDRIRYTYRKSLACSRAYLSYVSAYMKTHCFTEYFTALFNVYSGDAGKRDTYRGHFEKKGGKVLPPDVNRSFLIFAAEGKNIREPIDTAGDSELSTKIIEEREEGGNFESIGDFVRRLPGIKEEMLLRMTDVGVFDSVGESRKKVESELLELFEKRKIIKVNGAGQNRDDNNDGVHSRQLSIFDDGGDGD